MTGKLGPLVAVIAASFVLLFGGGAPAQDTVILGGSGLPGVEVDLDALEGIDRPYGVERLFMPGGQPDGARTIRPRPPEVSLAARSPAIETTPAKPAKAARAKQAARAAASIVTVKPLPAEKRKPVQPRVPAVMLPAEMGSDVAQITEPVAAPSVEPEEAAEVAVLAPADEPVAEAPPPPPAPEPESEPQTVIEEPTDAAPAEPEEAEPAEMSAPATTETVEAEAEEAEAGEPLQIVPPPPPPPAPEDPVTTAPVLTPPEPETAVAAAPAEPETSATPPPPPPAVTEEEDLPAIEPATQEDVTVASLPAADLPAVGETALQVRFDAGSSRLTAEAQQALQTVARAVIASDGRLQLKAYAGASGESVSTARRLSLSRALAVRAFLIEQDVRSTRIDVRALGVAADAGPPERVDLVYIRAIARLPQ